MSSRPTIVLVHGAFANAGCWAKLVPIMRAKGFSVVASHCPLSSLADDVDAVRRTIKMQDGAVFLVGHSWGGAVITEAGNEPQVRGLVYIAAAAPDSGQTFNAWRKDYPAAPGRSRNQAVARHCETNGREGTRSSIEPRTDDLAPRRGG